MLDNADKKLLYLLDQDCRQSATQLGKALRLHRNVVLYRIKRLEEAGVIRGYFAEIDMALLGYITFRAFVRLSNYTAEDKDCILADIKATPQLLWFIETGGKYDLDIVFAAKNIVEFNAFLNKIKMKHNRIIASLRIDTLTAITSYPKEYLLQKKRTEQTPTTRTVRKTQPHIDELDDGILHLLASDARTSIAEIANNTKLSVNTVKRRMADLEKSGIIIGYRVFIDTAKSGYTYRKLHITLRNYTPEECRTLQTAISLDNRTVYLTSYLNGEDIEAEMHFENDAALDTFVSMLRERYGRIIDEIHIIEFTKEHLFRFLPDVLPNNLQYNTTNTALDKTILHRK